MPARISISAGWRRRRFSRRKALPMPSPATAKAGGQVFQAVFEDLRARLRRGDWLPGERLPSIPQLARAIGVGTGSVREALRALEMIGLVRIEHGRGVFVSNLRPPDDLAQRAATDSRGLLLALAETRRLLEPELAALAAERGTVKELAEIEQLARQMEARALAGLDFADPDLRFHRQIAQAAHNPVLAQMMAGVTDLFLESRRVTSREPGMTERAVRYHVLIAEALRDRHPGQARLLMLAHMNDALTGLLAAAAAPPAFPPESEAPA